MNKQVDIIPTDRELELLQIQRDKNALALKEAKIKQEGEREKDIEKEKLRGKQALEVVKRKNEAVHNLMLDLTDYAGKGEYELVSKDKTINLKCYSYALKQDVEGKVYYDYKSKEQVYFEEELDYQDRHIKHIKSGRTIYPHLEKGTVIFRFSEYSSFGRHYTRAKKIDEIISEAYNSKVNKEQKIISEVEEQELLYNMCQRTYPQATSITKTKENIYNYTGRVKHNKEYAGDRLLIQVEFKSGLIINCTYGKPIKEGDKPYINIYSKNIGKLSNEDLLKHFGK